MTMIDTLGIEKIGISHCTGMRPTEKMARHFDDRFFFNNAGTIMEI